MGGPRGNEEEYFKEWIYILRILVFAFMPRIDGKDEIPAHVCVCSNKYRIYFSAKIRNLPASP